MTICIRDIN